MFSVIKRTKTYIVLAFPAWEGVASSCGGDVMSAAQARGSGYTASSVRQQPDNPKFEVHIMKSNSFGKLNISYVNTL